MMLHSSREDKMYIDNFLGYSRELFHLESVEYHNLGDLKSAEYTVLYDCLKIAKRILLTVMSYSSL